MYEYICNDCNHKFKYHLKSYFCHECNSENIKKVTEVAGKAYHTPENIELPLQTKFKKIYYQDQLWYWRREPKNTRKNKNKAIGKELRKNFLKRKNHLDF